MARKTLNSPVSKRLWRTSLAAATMLATVVAPGAALAQSGAQWTTQGGDPQGTRYSTLTDITPANAGTLVEEFNFPTNAKGSHQGGPLVIGSVMYVVTPFPDNLIAMDLTHPGTTLWTFKPNPGGFSRGLTCCDIVNRGPAYDAGTNSIVYTLLDGNVVSVDATKGTQNWRTKVADPWAGETLNTAPIIVNGKVIFGSSGSEQGIRGSVRALDVKTGKLVWQAYSTGPDKDALIGKNFHPYYAKDQGKNLGASTWPGTMWKQGGASTWEWVTYDPVTNQIFYGTSQPGTFNPDMRPGDNKWGVTIFARNPDTGQANWAYQLVPHDSWDFDATNENTVIDLPINGVTHHAIVNFHKGGFAYILDATTGQLLSANPFAFANWASSIDLTTGLPNVNQTLLTHQGTVTKGICPSAFGAKDWEWSTYSPNTKLFYFGAHTFCMDYEGLLALYIAGTPFTGASLAIYPSNQQGTMGEFVAYDPVKGQRAWTITEPLAVFGGALSTAGNVVFYGTMDKQFKAVDATSGKLLWSAPLECGVASPPITYTGPDGKQRVAITTGLGYLQGGFAGGACPAGNWFNNAKVTPPGGPSNVNYGGVSLPQGIAAINYGAAHQQAQQPGGPTSGFVHVYKLP